MDYHPMLFQHVTWNTFVGLAKALLVLYLSTVKVQVLRVLWEKEVAL